MPHKQILSQLKRRILRPLRAPYIGHVDGVDGVLLYGWVLERAKTAKAELAPSLRVGLFTQTGLLLSADASGSRPDVLAAGQPHGDCGFTFVLTPKIRDTIAKQGGKVAVRVLNASAFLVGHWHLPADNKTQTARATSQGSTWQAQCRLALGGDLERLEHLLVARAATDPLLPLAKPKSRTPDSNLHTKLFAPAPPAWPQHPPLPRYLDYVRQRDPEAPAEFEHFLNWYLESYSKQRPGLRIPLSRDLIAYLNSDMVMGGQDKVVSRIMWWHLARNMKPWAGGDMSSPATYLDICFWWAWEQAHSLQAEDCLVSPATIEALRALPAGQPQDSQDIQDGQYTWPLTPFLDRLVRDMPGFHFIHGENQQHRKTLCLSVLVLAAARPDLLRYLPDNMLKAAFAPGPDATTVFGAFLAELTATKTWAQLSQEQYAAALREVRFDLPSKQFLTRDSAGHRYQMTKVDPLAAQVDVQLIGPVKKTSGLGQAARLSAMALKQTGLSLNIVNFDLENPSPEGFCCVPKHAEFQRARINLIHLNAETLPLAVAYGPDVFNGAYNIGYFFWELDSPATCHQLALELLDEVWVSSQYGVDIYRPATAKPVHKVGMCYEPTPDITKAQARAFMFDLCGTDTGSFTFLMTFDSFSFTQRKNPIGVLQAFQQAFRADENTRLILKTQNRARVTDPAQAGIWQTIDAIVAEDARITAIDKTLPYLDMIKLKKAADCYVSLHRSEGWGFGMLEAMQLNVPVICTGYSGNMAFCTSQTAWLVAYQMVAPAPDDYLFVQPGQKWAEPDITDAARQMQAVYSAPLKREQKAAAAYAYIRQEFSVHATSTRYQARLTQILAEIDRRGDPSK